MEVRRTPTKLTKDQLAAVFLERFVHAFGSPPTRNEAELLFTLLSHEVAHGNSIIQHNWGNVIPSNDSQAYWRPRWTAPLAELEAMPENTDAQRAAKRRLIYLHNDPTAPKKFRAFPSHEAGANHWFKTLQSTTHQRIVDAAATGDVAKMHKAIAFPHPKTKMAYCPHCKADEVRAAYQSIRDDVHRSGRFAHLKADPAQEAGDLEPVGEVANRELERVSRLRHSQEWRSRFTSQRVGEIDTIWEGSEGNAVELAQRILRRWLTVGSLTVDGDFGLFTYEAVQMFQNAKQLKVDGIVGPVTWRELLAEVR